VDKITWTHDLQTLVRVQLRTVHVGLQASLPPEAVLNIRVHESVCNSGQIEVPAAALPLREAETRLRCPFQTLHEVIIPRKLEVDPGNGNQAIAAPVIREASRPTGALHVLIMSTATAHWPSDVFFVVPASGTEDGRGFHLSRVVCELAVAAVLEAVRTSASPTSLVTAIAFQKVTARLRVEALGMSAILLHLHLLRFSATARKGVNRIPAALVACWTKLKVATQFCRELGIPAARVLRSGSGRPEEP